MKKYFFALSLALFAAFFAGAQEARRFKMTTRDSDSAAAKDIYEPTGREPLVTIQEWHDDGKASKLEWRGNGKFIVTSSIENVKLWDARSGKLIKSLSKNEGIYPGTAAFSPDGKYIAYSSSVSGKSGIYIASITDSSQEPVMLDESNGSPQMTFSKDGKFLFAAGSESINIYNVAAKTKEKSFFPAMRFADGFCEAVEASDDFHYCAVLMSTGGSGFSWLLLYDLATEKCVEKMFVKDNLAMRFSPDSKLFAFSEGGDRNYHPIRIRNIETGNEKKIYYKDEDDSVLVESLAFSPDGATLFSTAAGDFSMRAWNTNTGEREESAFATAVNAFAPTRDAYKDIAAQSQNRAAYLSFSNDGTHAAVLKDNDSVEIRSYPDGTVIRLIEKSSRRNAMAYGAKKGIVYAFERVGLARRDLMDNISVFDANFDGTELPIKLESEKGILQGVHGLAASEDSLWYVKRNPGSDCIMQYDHKTGAAKKIKTISRGDALHYGMDMLAANGGGSKLLLRNFSGGEWTHYIYDVAKKDFLYAGSQERGEQTAFSPNFTFIVNYKLKENRFLTIFNTQTQKISSVNSPNFTMQYYSPIFSPDEKFLAAAALNKEAKNPSFGFIIYNVETGQQIYEYNGPAKAMELLAFSPDGKSVFFWSMNDTLCRYDLETKKIAWNRPLFGSTQLSNDSFFVSADGERLITQSEGGIIRCYSARTGTLLTSSIADSHGNWITYTPEGYFKGKKSEKFIHLVDGIEAFDLNQLYDTLFRPDLVAEKLSEKDIPAPKLREIFKEGNAPVVTIQELPAVQGSRNVSVRFSVQNAGGGIGSVYLSQNGRVIHVSRIGGKADDKTLDFSCECVLAPGKNLFEAYATNRGGKIESRHAATVAEWRGTPQAANFYALLLGVNEYGKMPSLNLQYSVPDAVSVTESFQNAPGGLYKSVTTMTLLDSEVTAQNIRRAFGALSELLSPDDIFVLYLAGHGKNLDGNYYFIPSDILLNDVSELTANDAAVSKDFLTENLAKIPAQKIIVLLDTCDSGAFIGAAKENGILARTTAFERMAHKSGQAIVTAAGDEEAAQEGFKGHGLFTYVLLQGLLGRANADANAFVSARELINFIQAEVPDIAKKNGLNEQKPWASPLKEDFYIIAAGTKKPVASRAINVDGTETLFERQYKNAKKGAKR